MNKTLEKITNGSLLVKNGLINLLGQGALIIIAIVTIPMLINGLGIERFGILSLVWMVTGYFSLFDLGVGRALTKIVSERLGSGSFVEIPTLVWSGMLLMLGLGVFGTLLVSAISPYLASEVLKIPKDLVDETTSVLYILAIAIPIIISTTCLRGVLEAYQRFDYINYVRVPVGMLTFLGPIYALQFSVSLVYITLLLVTVRLIEWAANLILCLKLNPKLYHKIIAKPSVMLYLISFGGWITVGNIIGPLITYLDRLLIGSIISITAVAYYTTPYEMIIRLMILPGALVGILFPAFSATYNINIYQTQQLFIKGIKYTFLLIFPAILILVTFAQEVLIFWLGQEFSINSTLVLQLLAVGALFNSLSYAPFALLQAAGRPEFTVKLNLIEAPCYLLALLWFVSNYGIEGAALAWVMRVTLETTILIIKAQQLLQGKILLKQFIIPVLVLALVLIISSFFPMNLEFKMAYVFTILVAFVISGWLLVLDGTERFFIINFFKKS